MVLVVQLKSLVKKKLFIGSVIVVTVLIGYAIYQRNQKNLTIAEEKADLSHLVKAVDDQRNELINYSLKRSQVQKKLLSSYKLLNEPLNKMLAGSDQIQFLNQKDFNDYEYFQNYIQDVLAKKIFQDLSSKNKNKEFREEISELERSEKILNEIRINFSKKEMALSKLKNRAPVTFLSDVQMLESKISK